MRHDRAIRCRMTKADKVAPGRSWGDWGGGGGGGGGGHSHADAQFQSHPRPQVTAHYRSHPAITGRPGASISMEA
jgi:hypothetical protein